MSATLRGERGAQPDPALGLQRAALLAKTRDATQRQVQTCSAVGTVLPCVAKERTNPRAPRCRFLDRRGAAGRFADDTEAFVDAAAASSCVPR
jgi:hypothetical protein